MRRLRKGLVLGLAIGLLGILVALFPQTAEIEEDLELPWLFHLRGTVSAPSDVVVVAIDEQSPRELGLPERPREWPRDLHARLVDQLARSGAKIIGFDFPFAPPPPPPFRREIWSCDRPGGECRAGRLAAQGDRSAPGQVQSGGQRDFDGKNHSTDSRSRAAGDCPRA